MAKNGVFLPRCVIRGKKWRFFATLYYFSLEYFYQIFVDIIV